MFWQYKEAEEKKKSMLQKYKEEEGEGGMPDIKQAPTLLAGEIYPPTFSPSSAMSELSTSFAPL